MQGLVRINGQQSGNFRMEKGMKQGDSLSPLLFITFMDQIIKQCRRRTRRYKFGNWKLRPIYLQSLIYADDIVLINNNVEDLQNAVIEWASTLEERGMAVNISKSKIMKIGGEKVNFEIKWKDQTLEQVNSYKYLGTIINDDGKLDEEINNRIRKANQVYYNLNNTIIGKREVNKKTKMQIYKTVYLPVLLYGAETWAMMDKHKSRVTASEMKYLRKVVGKTKRDRVRNINIRNELQQAPVVEQIERKQLNWFGHLVRMGDERKVKEVFESRVEGKRRRGRPRIEWEQYVNDVVRRRGKEIREIRRLALDRERYKKWVEDPTLQGIRDR